MKLAVYCDGACEPVNPGGTGTYGFVVLNEAGNELETGYGIVGSGPTISNNVAEYMSAAMGMRAAAKLVSRSDSVHVFGDNKMWVNQLTGGWKVRGGLYVAAFLEARAALDALRKTGATVEIRWIPRERNGRADELSKRALSEAGVSVRTHR